MKPILVIDDEQIIRELMIEILENAGYEVVGAETAGRALALLENVEFELVVSDVVMPGLTGLELLEGLRDDHPNLPVVLVTGAGTYDNIRAALARGASGLVTKPFAHADLVEAVADALVRAQRSERDLRERLLTPTLASALANAIEARDFYLHGHCERLAAFAVRLGERLGLAGHELEAIRLGAILHDVGKIGIPDRVLLKPGPLDDEERALVEQHPLIGDRLLEPLELLEAARPIVLSHHERWDGDGYPEGLAGEQIPLAARIVGVADAIEAMASRRLYGAPRSPGEIVEELRRCRGTQFDPRVVDLVLELLDCGDLRLRADGFDLEDEPNRPLTLERA